MQLKNYGRRKCNGKYVSLADFLVRTKLAYEETALLIRCGAMGCFKQTRQRCFVCWIFTFIVEK